MTKVIVLRHGESEWNHSNKFAGWIDVHLLEKGEREAKLAGHLIKRAGLRPVAMFTSKLTRTNQTGNLILEELDELWCDQHKSWRLNERHYGAYQGRDKSEVHEELGTTKYDYVRRDYNGKPPDVEGVDSSIDERYDGVDHALPRAESLRMVVNRFMPYFRENIVSKYGGLCRQNPHKAILIVTHGSVVRALMKSIGNISDQDISKINIPTGIPIVFEIDEEMNLVGDFTYLDKKAAEQGMEKVANEGKL